VNVLFTSPALFGEDGVYGGGERYAMELARAVARETGAATLYAAGARDAEWREGPLAIVLRRPWTRVRGQASNPLPRGLWRCVADADAVHCFQQHIVLTSVAAALARLRGIPAFATDLGGGGWDVSAYVDTSRWFAGLLHLSHYAARLAGREGDERDAVLYGGVWDGIGAAPAGTPSGTAGSVLFVGRLYPHKGADVLLEAARPEWPVVICGRPYDDRYTAELRALAAGKCVRFEPDADDARLAELYEQAAVVVVPSCGRDRYGRVTPVPELLGLVTLEAMARGLPVVASREASLPELVEDGVTGRLVPPRDTAALRGAVDELLASPERRSRLGAAGRERALTRFTWPAAARIAVRAYGNAVAA
jgi:glycosyltransferase involved in cell wall biosynthesis